MLYLDVRVNALAGLFAHMCFVLVCCALLGRSCWCAKHGFRSQVVCFRITFIVYCFRCILNADVQCVACFRFAQLYDLVLAQVLFVSCC